MQTTLSTGQPRRFPLQWVFFLVGWLSIALNIAGIEHQLLPSGAALPWFFAFCAAMARVEQLKQNPESRLLPTLQKIPLAIVMGSLILMSALIIYMKFFYVSPIK